MACLSRACKIFHFLKIFLDRNEWGGDNIEESFFYAMEVCNEKSFCGAFGRVDDFFRVFQRRGFVRQVRISRRLVRHQRFTQ